MLQKSQNIIISLLSCLSLICFGIYAAFTPDLLELREVSELIPDQGRIDQNQVSQLRATIFFIRQSFTLQSTSPAAWPYLFSYALISLGSVAMLYFLKRLVKISWLYLLAGLLIWIGIIAWNLPKNTNSQLMQLLAELANGLGALGILAICILSSASIPQFIFKIGHGQTYLLSRKNWLILAGFYIANLMLSYGNTFLQWDLGIHIPPLAFTLIAIVLFLWEGSTDYLLRAGLGAIALSAGFMYIFLGNDAGISAWEHWALICQITMALLFPLFVISNFQTPVLQNLPVHRITHKAPRVSLHLIYVGTLILGLAWVFARDGSSFHQTRAALSNQSGDLSWLFNDKKQAEFAYHQAMVSSKLNGQSSFRLANLALQANDLETAAYYLSTSQLKHPTSTSYVGLAGIFQQERKYFDALFTLKQADRQFPNKLPILTQLAHTYESLNIRDSAQYFYQKAALADENDEIGHANLLYALKKDVPLIASENPAIRANYLAIALKNGTMTTLEAPTAISPSGDLRTWGYLYNAMLYFKEKQTSLPIANWINAGYANKIFPELSFLDAWQDYHQKKPLQALEKLSLLVETDALGKLNAYSTIVDFWRKSMRMPMKKIQITDLASAQKAIEAYPFQVPVLQDAIPILNANKKEKQGYEASLQAARWNEDVAEFQWIYALQALKMGEIDYAKEAMNHLLALDNNMFTANKPEFERELEKAIGKQKF